VKVVDSIGGLDAAAFASSQRRLAIALLKTRKLFREVKPRLIHIHGPYTAVGNAASVVAQSLGIPVILHVHGRIDDTLSHHMQTRFHTADRVIAVSQNVLESISKDTGRVAGVQVIRNGLPDPRFLHPAVKSEVATINLIGRLEKTKGFHDALTACAPLTEKFPALRINIVGVGGEEQNLRALAWQLGLGDRVRFHGRQEQFATLDLINAGTVTVVPSLAYEGFSLVALESAFLEKPVVANRIGGLPETVRDGQTGAIVEPGDIPALTQAIERYLGDPELARSHGANARERALKEFSINRMAAEITALHEEVLENSGVVHSHTSSV
jgi:glycosyltransferase involved in cell wall biosynthesis